MAAQLAAQGSSIAEHLEQLYQRYGQFIYRAGYYVSDPPSKSQGVFAGLRQGGNYPQVGHPRVFCISISIDMGMPAAG